MSRFIVQGYPAYAYTGGREFDVTRPAVVMVHGTALDHSVWQWQSRYLAHHGFSVLAVDLPGHGRSPGSARDTVEGLAEWVLALLEAAGVAKASWVGHSMGSLAVLQAALARPDAVEKLVLVGPSVPMPVGEPFLAAARDDDAAAFDMQSVWGHARQVALATSPIPGTTVLDAGRQLVGRARPGVQQAGLDACHAWRPDPAALQALAVPTLVVVGRKDAMTPPRAGRALAAQIPNARLVELDAGHSMMSEAPRPLLAALRSFL